jgi:hypothetical protein
MPCAPQDSDPDVEDDATIIPELAMLSLPSSLPDSLRKTPSLVTLLQLEIHMHIAQANDALGNSEG